MVHLPTFIIKISIHIGKYTVRPMDPSWELNQLSLLGPMDTRTPENDTIRMQHRPSSTSLKVFTTQDAS